MRWLGFHFHDRKMFLVGNYCVVKCIDCGMESIPWEVSQAKADAARPYHLGDAEEILLINPRSEP